MITHGYESLVNPSYMKSWLPVCKLCHIQYLCAKFVHIIFHMDISYQTDVSKPNSLEDGIISCWTIGCSSEDGPVRARSADLERGLFLFLSFHLKKLRRAEGGAKIFGVFRVKNHDFTPKKSYFFNCRGRRENFWGISCEKSRFYAKKSYFFPILGGARAGCAPPPESAPALIFAYSCLTINTQSWLPVCKLCHIQYLCAKFVHIIFHMDISYQTDVSHNVVSPERDSNLQR
jgi:hypothetical protein